MTAHDERERFQSRFRSLRALIGNTPLVHIHACVDGVPVQVFAKYEQTNMTGSIKDRMALQILEEAWNAGHLCENTTIAEATSGNTGIAFAALGRAVHCKVRIYMPDWMSRERVLLIQSLGAEVVPVSKEGGGFLGSIEQADQFAANSAERVFLPHQFRTEANVRAHERTTGPELAAQLTRLGCRPDAFVAGVGTGGTVMGTGRALRRAFPEIHVHPLEPANSPTMRTGTKVGSHRIQGISDEFVPEIVKLEELDAIIDVWDGDAILMAQRLARELGLGVGISSGANLLGALSLARDLGPEAKVATVFPDCNKKYLSTDLMHQEPLRADYLTPQVSFERVQVHAGGPTLHDS